MPTLISSLIALLFSAAILIFLIKSDTKRHGKGQVGIYINHRLRFLLLLLFCAPAVVLVVLGLYSSTLIWLGGATLLGWVLALMPTRLV